MDYTFALGLFISYYLEAVESKTYYFNVRSHLQNKVYGDLKRLQMSETTFKRGWRVVRIKERNHEFEMGGGRRRSSCGRSAHYERKARSSYGRGYTLPCSLSLILKYSHTNRDKKKKYNGSKFGRGGGGSAPPESATRMGQLYWNARARFWYQSALTARDDTYEEFHRKTG